MWVVVDVICGIIFGEGFDIIYLDLKKFLEFCVYVVDNEEIV